MAVPLLRGLLLLRQRIHYHFHHCRVATISFPYRLLSTVTEPPSPPSESSADSLSGGRSIAELHGDIRLVRLATQEILHSDRYLDGERLTAVDEAFVRDRLLPYHPQSEDKIGCGVDSIMVDRHPHFIRSRCFFVVRTDGEWIDFSYKKCLRGLRNYNREN